MRGESEDGNRTAHYSPDMGRWALGQAGQRDDFAAGDAVLFGSHGSRAAYATILLVEDEAFVREVAGQVLCSAGYSVLTARNASEALLAFREHPEAVQLLLTDVVLPDRNGCDLALELAGLCRNIRTIFTSGYPENSVTRKALPPGCSYLPKPFSADSLLRKVRDVLDIEIGDSI